MAKNSKKEEKPETPVVSETTEIPALTDEPTATEQPAVSPAPALADEPVPTVTPNLPDVETDPASLIGDAVTDPLPGISPEPATTNTVPFPNLPPIESTAQPTVETPPTPTPQKPGRPKGSLNKPKFGELLPPPPVGEIKPVDYGAMAAVTFDMSINSLTMIFGNEWQPQNKQERQMVVEAIAAYMKSKEMQDLPPGVMLAFILAAYSAPRIQHPNTRGKLIVMWMWCKDKANAFGKKFRLW